MIKGVGVMHLDGDFRRAVPRPEKYSYLDGDTWYVISRGPRYINQYRVTEFDDEGERWLKANEQKHDADVPEVAL